MRGKEGRRIDGSRDRPASEPGGCECVKCGCVFIGAESHALCAVCAALVPVTRVTTVYGDRCYVATADLNGTQWKHMLPLYTRDGRCWADTRAGIAAARRGDATMLARANIEGNAS